MKQLGNIFIMGDSYSTYEGYIPEGYSCYYDKDCISVNQVEKTWWHRLLTETKGTLTLNDSYSGSTVCNTGWNGVYCPTTSFIGRLDKYIDEDFFSENEVETALIFGGTNDSWADAPLGELQYEGWTEESLKATLPALCYLLHRLTTAVPFVNVIVIINSELKPEVMEGYAEAARHYGVQHIQLGDVDKVSGHPTDKGMEQIKNQVLEAL